MFELFFDDRTEKKTKKTMQLHFNLSLIDTRGDEKEKKAEINTNVYK